jgi:hypothetical protein
MGRLTSVLVAGALAVAVSVVVAGPAAAAKGGNSDNAHACQQGGSGGLVEAETGLSFKNAGDCASHGAQGNDTNGLVLSLSMSPSYACSFGPNCYGTLTGSGLVPNSTVKLFVTFNTPGPPLESDAKADSNGNLSAQVDDTCPTGGIAIISAYATGTLAANNMPVQTPVVNDPCFNGKGR